MKLSIVFPAFNEGQRILPVLNKYYLFFKRRMKKNFEIIIVPNNCSDNTVEVVKKFCSGKKEVRFFNIRGYSGKGGAVMKGFSLAKAELIGFVDADESTSVEEFFKLYENIEDYDGIIGSRKIEGARIVPRRSFGKNIGSWFFGLIIRVLFSFKYKDTQCGVKIFRKNVAKYLVKNFKESGWIFDIDLLNLCEKKGYKIKEFPILWSDDEGSHIGSWDGVKSVFGVIKYRFTFSYHM